MSASRMMDALRSPRLVAVIGASDDDGSFGGRFWRHLGMSSSIERVAVNLRAGAVRGGPTVAALQELAHSPDLVVIATPSPTVEGLVEDCVAVGAGAAVVLASVPEDARARIAKRCEGRLALLGGSSLGLVDANRGVFLSSSVSLELPVHGGPLALVSQSGALMGVLHARAMRQGIGLGVCASTGEQLDVRVEHLLTELAADDNLTAVGAYLEDVDPTLFCAAAQRLLEAGRRVVVLKGGLTTRGASVTAAHSGALSSDGRAFAALMSDLDVVVADDPDDLLNCLHVSGFDGRRFFVGTLSGGIAAIAADLAVAVGVELAEPGMANVHSAEASTEPLALRNPVDVDALAPVDDDAARLLAGLARHEDGDGLVLVLSDRPALESLLERIRDLNPADLARTVFCSECSGQYEPMLTDVLVPRLGFVRGVGPLLRAIVKTRTPGGGRSAGRGPESSEGLGVLDASSTWRLLDAAGIPTVPLMAARSLADVDAALDLWGPCVVFKRDRVGHRAQAEVVRVEDDDAAHAAFERLSKGGDVVVQQQSEPGLEFFVGIACDPVFGTLFCIGAGGPLVEALADVTVHIGLPSRQEIGALLAKTAAGRWLETSIGRELVDMDALLDVAAGLCALVRARDDVVTIDANPVVVGPLGARVLDAKVWIRSLGSE